MNGTDLVKQAFNRMMGETEQERFDNVSKAIDFYEGDQDEYTTEKLKLPEAGKDDFPYTHSNITKWIAKKISYVYKTAPERDISDAYKNLIVNKDGWFKETERQARIFQTVAVRPYTSNDVFDYQIVRLFKGVCDPQKPSIFKKIWYPISYEGFNKIWAYWDEERFSILDNYGRVIDGKKKGDKKLREAFGVKENDENIYKRIPFVFCRFSKVVDDCWTGGGFDIINCNEQINLALTELNWLARYAAFKQLIIISPNDTDKVEIGYNKAIRLTPADNNSGQTSSAELLDLQADFNGYFTIIKNQLDLIAKTRGMSMNWELANSPSGFSLVVKNIDLLENWEDDIEMCRQWEREMLDMEKTVYKVEKKKALPQSDLKVNFQDVKFPIDPKEERENNDWLVERNYRTYIDVMRQYDKDATDEELKQKYLENKKINEELNAQEVVPFGGVVE